MPASTYRFILHARAAFPYSDPAAKQTTQAWSQTPPVSDALALLPEDERQKALRFYFPRDAALSLASSLLKHYIIVRTCGAAWDQSPILQDQSIQNGKPYYAKGGVEFNVSHHGEAAVLIATTKPGVKVGIDLTHVSMEKDVPKLRREGFNEWVKVFESVFSAQEVRGMLQAGPKGANPDTPALVQGLRTFYSYWALKEAYFKMTGDALLASWLQELAFSNVRPPAATGSSISAWTVGETTKAAASLRGKAIDDTQLELSALGEHYIAATSITSFEALPPFEVVDVQRDVLPLAG
jgi:4'-phosphopantetheinyl transferase